MESSEDFEDRSTDSDDLITWQAPEYIYREKSADWYWILGIVTIALVIIAFLLNSLLFAIFLILAGTTVALYGSRKPETLNFSANDKGIRVKNQLYPYSTLDKFSIDDAADEKIIILESKKKAMPYIIIPLGESNTVEVRNFISRFLPEEYIERPWTQLLMDRIGF